MSDRPREFIVYIGAAHGGPDQGIYIYRLAMETGELRPSGAMKDVHNPSFFAVHPSGRFLYSIDEDRSRQDSEAGVKAFAVDQKSGALTPINRRSSQGRGLAHVLCDREGRYVLAAHYAGGSISVLPISEDGSLGEATDSIRHEGSSVHPRQTEPHPHSIHVDPDNRYVFVPDLGLDRIVTYRFRTDSGRLELNDPSGPKVAPGSGPRHFTFHPNGELAYVINEIASTITAFNYDPERGALEAFQTISTLPNDFSGDNTTAEVVIHPSAKFLYGSNRGHDSIAMYTVGAEDGRLSLIGHEPTQGGHPRNFALDPTGTYLFAENRDSDTVVTFQINPETGWLQPTGHVTHVPRPVCIKMIPAAE